MNNQTRHHETNPASLESNGIVYGLAQACVETLRAIADKATPESLIQQAAQSIDDDNPEHVANFLHQVLTELHTFLGEPGTVKVAL